MPDERDDSLMDLPDSETDISELLDPEAGAGEGEAEPEGEPKAAPDTDGAEKRLKDTQQWAHQLAEQNAAKDAKIAELVDMVSRTQVQQQAPAAPAPDDAALNAEAEMLAKTKGAGIAIRELAAREAESRTGEVRGMVEYLASKLQSLELAAQNPDAAKYKPRIEKIYADASAGKLNIDQLTYRLAKAEEAVETAIKTGTVPRKPDSPARGAMTGAGGRKPGAEAFNPETASDEELQREILRTLPPGEREIFLRRHPKLRAR